MSEYAYFYNSENGDRVYDANSFSNWLKKFFTTGVFEGDCQVTALGSMVVNLAPGYANIMGKVKNLENQTFTLEPADGSYPRIDTIVIERNDTDRDITAKLVTGELSGNDPVPTPRVWENGVYQLVVAEIYVAAGATEVTQADITDKRFDPDVCGIVAGTVTEMDFSQFTAQFESYFEQFKASNLEEFSEWFEMIRGQLSEDAAGHLQNEIDALDLRVTNGFINVNYHLNGFMFYPSGTQIVGLVSNDKPYENDDGYYILANSPTGQTMIDNVEYKAINSEEDTRGYYGEDIAIPFGGGGETVQFIGSYVGNQTNIDVSQYVKSGDTVDNFIVEYLGINSADSGWVDYSSRPYGKVVVAPLTLAKTLSGTNLSITVNSSASEWRSSSNSGGNAVITATISVKFNLYYRKI